jgi:hypothetical protein
VEPDRVRRPRRRPAVFWLLLVLRTAVALFCGVVVAALTWLVSQEMPAVVRLAAATITAVAIWVTGARSDGAALRQHQEEAHAQRAQSRQP